MTSCPQHIFDASQSQLKNVIKWKFGVVRVVLFVPIKTRKNLKPLELTETNWNDLKWPETTQELNETTHEVTETTWNQLYYRFFTKTKLFSGSFCLKDYP